MQARVLSYEVGEDDWVTYHLHRLETRAETRTLIRTGQLAVGATGGLVMLGAALIAQPPLLFHLSLGIFVLLGVGLYPRTFRRSAQTRIRKLVAREDLADALGAQTLTVDDDGVTRQGPGGEALRTPWAAIEEIVATGGHVFIRFDELRAHVIPRGAFASSADVHDFVAAARAHMDAAAA